MNGKVVRHTMNAKQIASLCLLWFGLVSCGKASLLDHTTPLDTRVYMTEDDAESQIPFIWIELPSRLEIGRNDVRVFMARRDPPGMLVPMETELPCILHSANDYLEMHPVTLPFEFDGHQLVGSYAWRACASCVECYMDWETTLEMAATLEQDMMMLSTGIRHMGHNIREDYMRVDLELASPTAKEPRIQCWSTSECRQVEFAR